MHFLQGKKKRLLSGLRRKDREENKNSTYSKGLGLLEGGGVQLDEDDKSLRLRDLSCDNFLLASLTA